MKMNVAHVSMQFNDTKSQHAADVAAIAERAKAKRYGWITGTEADDTARGLASQLHRGLGDAGYHFFRPARPTDCWIAVREDLVDNGWKHGYIPLIKGAKATGDPHHYGPKGIVWVEFNDSEIGPCAVSAAHYLTNGKRPTRTPDPVNHLAENKKFGQAIAKWAVDRGAEGRLVFFGGDTNLIDRTTDVFFGGPMTSVWDEVHHWENTGHGNIDVIATYDRNKRVKAVRIHALDDSEFRLNTDHFFVEAVLDIDPLPSKPEPVRHSCPSCGNVHSGVVQH